MKQMIRFPFVRLLALCLLGLVLGIQTGIGGAQVGAGSQQQGGAQAQRFLDQERMLQTVTQTLSSEGNPFVERAKLTADDGAAWDFFGYSVALDGDTALLGAYKATVDGNTFQGAVYVFTRNGTAWIQQAKLTASDGAGGDWFGYQVALDGDTALVGTSSADVGGNIDQGAVYVFTRSGSNWSQQAKLTAGDGAAYDYFGNSLALDGDTMLVGALEFDLDGNAWQGATYVFARSGSDWIQQAKLIATDGVAEDYFGYQVALDGDTALVGAYGADIDGKINQGAAYVFMRTGSVWSQQAKLIAGDGSAEDRFSSRVALDGDTALLGAHGVDVGGNVDQGAAYVFFRSGSSWSEQSKLTAADGAAQDGFGRSLALEGGTALVGANRADIEGNEYQGAVYFFLHVGSSWSQQSRLTAGDGAAGDYFGSSVALDGDTALVGAYSADVGGNSDQGAAYVYERETPDVPIEGLEASNDGRTMLGQSTTFSATISGGTNVSYTWDFDDGQTGAGAVVSHLYLAPGTYTATVTATNNTSSMTAATVVVIEPGNSFSQTAKLTVSDGTTVDFFGTSVALDGNTALVGAVLVDVDSNADQGAAYIFTRAGSSWNEQSRLVASDGATGDYFGYLVALDGDTALVSALAADIGGNVGQGAVYVFTRDGTTWSQQAKLTASDGRAADFFGTSVALDGNTALVGTSSADVGGNISQGAVYVFTRSGSNWSQQAKLVAGDGAAGDSFGWSVALDGDTALVGAAGVDVDGKVNQGAAYIFTGSGPTWNQEAKVTANDGEMHDGFGFPVALDGDTALIGASGKDVDGKENQGATYVFMRSGSGWSQQTKLVASDAKAQDYFGESLALDGDTALIGASVSDDDQGATYVFIRNGSNWSQQSRLIALDGTVADRFGVSLALDGNTAMVGANAADTAQGAVYVFEREATDYLTYLPMAIR